MPERGGRQVNRLGIPRAEAPRAECRPAGVTTSAICSKSCPNALKAARLARLAFVAGYQAKPSPRRGQIASWERNTTLFAFPAAQPATCPPPMSRRRLPVPLLEPATTRPEALQNPFKLIDRAERRPPDAACLLPLARAGVQFVNGATSKPKSFLSA